MTTLVSEVIQWAQMQGLSTVNLSVGRDVSKTRWGPQERLFSDHYLAGAGSINRRLMQALVRRRGLSVGYLTAEQADQQARQSAEPEKA